MSGHDFYPTANKVATEEEKQQAIDNQPKSTTQLIVPVYQPINSNINDLTIEMLDDLRTNLLEEDSLIVTQEAGEIIETKLNPSIGDNTELIISANEISSTPEIERTATATIERNSFNQTTSMPSFKRYITPIYPQHYWYNQVEQDVIATFKIKPNGNVYDINVKSQKNQFIAFEQEVKRALKRWKFDPNSLTHSTLQRTYQQMFSFAISEEVEKNCELSHTGSRLKKPMPCNK